MKNINRELLFQFFFCCCSEHSKISIARRNDLILLLNTCATPLRRTRLMLTQLCQAMKPGRGPRRNHPGERDIDFSSPPSRLASLAARGSEQEFAASPFSDRFVCLFLRPCNSYSVAFSVCQTIVKDGVISVESCGLSVTVERAIYRKTNTPLSTARLS